MAPRAASLRTAAAPSVRIAQVQRTADALVAHAHLHDASKIATESRNSYIAIEDGHVRVVSSPTATAAGPFDAESARLASRFLRAVGAPASRRLLETSSSAIDGAAARAALAGARSAEARVRALRELQSWLGLPTLPRRIESLDVSHWMGAAAVVACATLRDGVAAPAEHRRWAVSGAVTPSDDCGALREGVRWQLASSAASGVPPADLLLVDGGKAQLSAVADAAADAAAAAGRRFAGAPPLVALVKGEEEVYVEGDAAPLRRPAGGAEAAALLVLRRARDEAHSAALLAHRHLRDDAGLRDALASLRVRGLGATRRAAWGS